MNKSKRKIISGLLTFFMLFTTNFISFGSMNRVLAEEVYASDLFISEYIEGGGVGNKALEIYNGTGHTVELSQYSIELYSNGSTEASQSVTLSGSLKSGKVHVIAHEGSDIPEDKINETNNSTINFNGNDAIVLKCGDKIVDSFGKVGENPGKNWGSGDYSTKDHTLVRKSKIIKGDTIEDDDFDPSLEWVSYPKNTFEHLGSHTMEGSGTTEPVILTGLELPQTAEVTEGKTVKLSVTYVPVDTTEREVIWMSSDDNTATVSQDGTVTGVKEGEVTITATSKEHENISASCIVTIKKSVPVELISIAEARAADKGTEVVVEAFVTSVPGSFGGKSFYVQDDTAGALVYTNSVETAAVIGNKVKISGKTAEYNGKFEIIPSAIEVINTEATEIKAKEIKINEITETSEAQLVTIKNVQVTKIGTDSYKNAYITISDGTNEGTVKLDSRTGKSVEDLTIKENDNIDVVGVVEQNKSDAYRIIIRTLEDITKVDLEPDTTAPVINHTAITKSNINLDLEIKAVVTDDRQVASVKLYYRTKGQTAYKTLDMSLSNNEYSAIISKAELSTAGLEYYIEASDGTNNVTNPADSNSPYEVSIVNVDIAGPTITSVTPYEGQTLEATDTKPGIRAEYTDENGIDEASVKLFVDNVDVISSATVKVDSVSYAPDANLELGKHVVKVEVSDKLGNKTSKTWTFSIGKEEYNHYRGQLHSHTSYSDGKGTADEAFAWARDKGKADYFAITDHSNWFDSEDVSNETITDINDSTSQEWKDMHKKADNYNKDGEFVAIAGYEMTWSGSTGGWGHINTFNTPWFASRSNKKMNLQAYYNRIAEDTDSISQLNHPGKTFGDFADFGFYSEAADNVVHLIEVGNGEGPIRGSGYFPSYQYYTRALDKGWHVAPTNNQDNHKGNWITSNEARTVILAEELNRDNIYDGIKKMRIYSSEDSNLEINYTMNGMPMGSSLDEPEALNIAIDIKDIDDGDRIKKVQLISNGGVISASKEFDSTNVTWNFELEPQYTYYYVKVVQVDGDIAVTAPVWTAKMTPVGISKVEASQDIVELNDSVDLEAVVYNNGETLLEGAVVEFYKNKVLPENKIGEVNVNGIAQGATGTAKITWTPNEAGNYKVYAATTINVDGVDKVFTVSTEIDVMNKEDIVKVVIDAGHMNQYVSGSYAGKITEFKNILKNKKMMAVENHDAITAEDLKDASILVITSPQPTDYSKYDLKKSKLSDEEIKAVKDFVDAGGSLIITTRADYKDGEGDYQNAVQGNRILEEIGSNIRMNDAQVIDNTNNGGQAYRLMFNNFTSTKFGLTEGSEVSNHEYSFYSGAPVMLKENGDGTNVDFLVKGHSTTEISDADRAGDATPTDKGQVYVLAAEKLSSGGKVTAAGSTFFSDFEVSGDNINSNIQITKNILNWMKPVQEVELKTIADVRRDDNGDGIPDNLGKKFMIEGRITAESEAYTKAHGRNNAFFEVIYVQDETAGITVFGVSQKEIPLGTKVRVTGKVEQYQGDAEIEIKDENVDVVVLDDALELVAPIKMSTGDSMLEEKEGTLVEVIGAVTRIETESDNSIYINDGTGEARIFVEGYIGDGTGNEAMLGKWDSNIKVGDRVKAVGLSSEDPIGHRLRVRNTTEIVKAHEEGIVIENLSNVTEVEVNGEVNLKVRATNNFKEEMKVTLIIGLYDEDNRFIKHVICTHELKAGETKALSESMIVLPGAKVVKCFVWDTLDGMKPLSEIIVIPVK